MPLHKLEKRAPVLPLREELLKLYAEQRAEDDLENPMLEPPTLVFYQGQLWNTLAIVMFKHLGPSRSGEVRVTVTCCPDDESNEGIFVYSYFHHEGVSSAVVGSPYWFEMVQLAVDGLEAHRSGNPDKSYHDYVETIEECLILYEVQKIIENYKTGKDLTELYPRRK